MRTFLLIIYEAFLSLNFEVTSHSCIYLVEIKIDIYSSICEPLIPK
jgi:hypothetical protein